MYFGAIRTVSSSMSVHELVWAVSLITVSYNVIVLVMSVVTVLYKRTRLGLG